MKRSTFLHLRIPFSFFLLPVFLFASAVANEVDWFNFILIFIILHLLIYPASNGYNSYFDKDEKSIGGLENPPPVSKELYRTSLIFDLLGLGLGLLISVEFVVLIFVYGLVSKAYSHPAVRLKKFPIIGWLAAGIFQGYFTFIACYIGLNDMFLSGIWITEIQLPAVLSSAVFLGSYPMTQVYQHEEDGKRGDQTISRMLGIRGTFHFTALMFSLAIAGFVYFFYSYSSMTNTITFLLFMVPVLFYFANWYFRVRKNENEAGFKSTMRLNFISAVCLNLFFLTWWLF